MAKRIGLARTTALVNSSPVPLEQDKVALKGRFGVSAAGITTSTALTDDDSGEIILIDNSGGTTITVTLPTPVIGLHYNFYLSTSPNGKILFTSADAAQRITGLWWSAIPGAEDNYGSFNLINSATIGFPSGTSRGANFEIVCIDTTTGGGAINWVIIRGESGDTPYVLS
jgi:hypothetical protein